MAQKITTPNGEELVLLSRAEYDRLVALAGEAEDDAADVAAYDAAMAEGGGGRLPAEVSAALLSGASLVAAIRKWRGLKQTELAARAGLSQSYLSDLEGRRRKGSTDSLSALANALDVPADWLS